MKKDIYVFKWLILAFNNIDANYGQGRIEFYG